MKQTRVILVVPCILFIVAVSGFAGIGRMLVHFAVQAGSMNFPAIQVRPKLDLESEACLQCHDEIGVSGSDTTDILIPSHSTSNGRGPSHPVGIIYELSQTKSPDRFRPLSMLNPDIELADGRIGCRSCHAINKPADKNPLVPPDNTLRSDSAECLASDDLTVQGGMTDLCLSCHKK